MQSVELHLHAENSLLDGLNNAEEYMKRASEMGMTHLALTDHGVLSGHRPFQRAAKAAGITPILGCEMYISETDRFDRRSKAKRSDDTQVFNHIIVLAQNETGLNNLNRMSEVAWTEGFYTKPRIDLDLLEEHQEGLIVLSGCINGIISRALEREQTELANQYTARLKDTFGDRFFMEIQGHNPPELNAGLLEVASKHDVRPVVTSDCHYARKEDLWRCDAMLILSTGPNPNKSFDFSKSQKMEMMERLNYAYPERKMTFQEYEIFLRSWEEHDALLAAQGISDEAIYNTLEVAKMIGDYPYHERLDFMPRPVDGDPDEILRKLAWKGLEDRGFLGNEEYEKRLTEELEIIISMGFSAYFLIEEDTIRWGREQDIRFGPGRGSGCGCLVLYCLKVTGVDPIKHNLLMFRFINPERVEPPDVDNDVAIDRRSEIKAYKTRRYKHAASIATFGRTGGKESVRDASRVFRVPLGEVNKALKGADWLTNWWEFWEKTDKAKIFKAKYPEVIEFAKYLFGRLRKQGMHAGGLILSNQPINTFAPMQSAEDNSDASKTRIPLVALDMNEVAEIGFIKFDWLGLNALTVIDDTIKMVKERTGRDLDEEFNMLETLPLDDPIIYQKLSEGWTRGCFQVEQNAYTNLLIGMGGVKNFDELVTSNALVRPGASKSDVAKHFIARKSGDEITEYVHPDTKWFTEETYGLIIYQEQVMLAMTELAGMSMGTADKVRKIIGKKRDVSEFEQYKKEFVDGASLKVSKEIAEGLWHDFEAHAGYSFNKSHSVAYSMLTYWTAWLKEYYPLEFQCATLRNEGDKDKLVDYLMETKRMGLKVVLPHVNASGARFEIQTDERGDFLRFGLSNIKGISTKGAANIIAHRPFKDYDNLRTEINKKGNGLTIGMLKGLNAVGGAEFKDNPRAGNERDNYYEILGIPAFKGAEIPPKIRMQFRDLDEYSDKDTFLCMAMMRDVKIGDGWARADFMDETASASAFTDQNTQIEKGQLYVLLIANNRIVRYITVDELVAGQGGGFRKFLGQNKLLDVPPPMKKVISFRTRLTRGGERMADVVFADEDKNLTSAMVWPSQFMSAYSRLREGEVVDVQLSRTKDDTANFVSRIL